VLANRDHTKDHEATLTFSETDIKLYKMNKKTGKWGAVKLLEQEVEVEEEKAKEEGEEETKEKVKKTVFVVKIMMEAGGGELLGVVKKK